MATTTTSTIAHHKAVFVNVALVVLALAYVYHFVRQRIEVFGVGAVFENVNTTGCASFGKGNFEYSLNAKKTPQPSLPIISFVLT